MPALTERLDFLDGVEHSQRELARNSIMRRDGWGKNDADFSQYCILAKRAKDINLEAVIRTRLARYTTNIALDLAGGTNGVALQWLYK